MKIPLPKPSRARFLGIFSLLFTNLLAVNAFDASSFATHVDFAADTLQTGIALGDLDGDGKPDAVIPNYYGGSVSVFRNSSTIGIVNAASFATRVNFGAAHTPVHVLLADVDGDGKLDIVCINEGGAEISLLRNTTTAGVIDSNSFAPKLALTTPNGPYWAALKDLNGDNKPDLIVSCYDSGALSIFQNNSVSGTLSFGARIDLGFDAASASVEAGDIDGDGKADLVVGSANTAVIWIYRNVSGSSLSASSFAPRVTIPSGRGTTVTLADIDGDGKLDMVTPNATDNNVSVWRNTSTPGVIDSSSFATRVDFPTGLYPYRCVISDLDGDGHPDLIIPNSASHTISVFRNLSTAGGFASGSLASRVDYPTANSPRIAAIADVDGDGLPDIAHANVGQSSFSVLRQVGTNSPPPPPPPPPAIANDFNLSRDFSATLNPAGVWSYGWKGSVSGSFSLVTQTGTATFDNGVPVHAWVLAGVGQPAVYANDSSSTGIGAGGQFVMAPGTVWVHPGLNGHPENFGAVRFTAPSNSNYRVETRVDSIYSGYLSHDNDIHVAVNGAEVFGQMLPPNSGAGYTNIVALNAGDTIDFAVGRGADGNEYGSALKLAAIITPTTDTGIVITNPPPPPPPAIANDFNLSRDFSATVNPSGAWGYGWKSSLNGSFTLDPFNFSVTSDNGVPVSGWAANHTYGLPAHYCNTSGSTGTGAGGQFVVPPGTFWMHPGRMGQPENFGAVRFVAPSNSNYRVETRADSLYSGNLSGDTDFHVVVNGIEVFGEALAATTGTAWTNIVSLNTGETIDFALGRGADGNDYGAGLKLAAIITPTTDAAMVITNPPADGPVIVSEPPAFQSVNAGATVQLSVTASGQAPIVYQWLFNGIAIQGGNSTTLTLSNVQPAESGTYRVIVSNAVGFALSSVSTLNVLSIGTGGTLLFANNSTNRIFDVGAESFVPAGGSLVVGLFAGSTADSLQQIGPVTSFLLPGRFTGGLRSVSNVPPGQSAAVQIKVWDSALGSTYESASVAGGRRGMSTVFQVVLGGGIQLPGGLNAMPSFALSLSGLAASPVKAQPLFPPELRSISCSERGCTFILSGLPGATYAIEVSTDLNDWNTIAYILNSSGTAGYTDTHMSGNRRFYRARYVSP